MTAPAVDITQITSQKLRLLPIQGFFGATWVCRDLVLNCDVVMKELPLTDPAEVKKALGEAQRMERASHRHVARIRAVGQDDTQPIVRIVMPLYTRGCLEQKMRNEEGSLTVADALRYVGQVLAALEYTHQQGMIHADIKPSNVLIGDDGEALLTDFGQAEDLQTGGLAPGMAPNPQQYFSMRTPESYSKLPADVTTDIYQTGLLLYRLINGKRMWKQQLIHALAQAYPGMIADPATDAAAWALDEGGLNTSVYPILGPLVIRGTWPVRTLWQPHIPLSIRRIIRKAISLDPSDRFQSATEMKNALAAPVFKDAESRCKVTDDADGWSYENRSNQQAYRSSLQYAGGVWELTSSRTNVTRGTVTNLPAHSSTHQGPGNQAKAFRAMEDRIKEL